MIGRIAQLRHLGRFTTFTHATDHDLRFRRLTLLFARNASGKTTLARVIAAAGSDAVELADHATLGSSQPPEVTLDLEGGGKVRFDGTAWKGERPKVRVFDREFIESNVVVGRTPSKATRAALLEIALGAESVASKNRLDEIAARGRELTSELRPHVVAIRTAAEAAGLTDAEFLALPPVLDDAAERAQLQAKEREAITADEVHKRPVPERLPRPPELELDGLVVLLRRSAARLGDEAETAVRTHLERRLGGAALGWVREGVRHDDGVSCPYCGQGTKGIELIRHYRGWFDAAWDRLSADVGSAAKSLERLDVWWEQVKRLGIGNLKACEAWSDLPELTPPTLDSPTRRVELERVKAGLGAVIAAKQSRLGDAVDGAAEVRRARVDLDGIQAAVDAYNEQVDGCLRVIKSRNDVLAGLSVDDARRDLRRLDARVQRHGAALCSAIAKRDRIEQERAENERAKAAAEAALKEKSESKLDAFGARINDLLADLCADFRIEKLGTERMGGAAAARFTLKVDLGERDVRELVVSNKEGEARLARVLSDGDRSTLALAVFFASLDDFDDLAEQIVVFDDPMTSLDLRRCAATAEKITDVTRVARQVFVFSHHAPFLALVAHAWTRFGDKGNEALLQEVELDRGSRAITSWRSEEHVAHEHVRRWRELRAFVDDPGLDGQARHIHGEIRAFLEGYVRLRWPDIFNGVNEPLEPVIRRLKAGRALREASTSLTEDDLVRLDRLCSFGAGGNHDGSHRTVEAPEPEAVRAKAAEALEFARCSR